MKKNRKQRVPSERKKSNAVLYNNHDINFTFSPATTVKWMLSVN
jgi:hypothetical protein